MAEWEGCEKEGEDIKYYNSRKMMKNLTGNIN
jgi:hypothetical protein